jgi:hypothetical protein
LSTFLCTIKIQVDYNNEFVCPLIFARVVLQVSRNRLIIIILCFSTVTDVNNRGEEKRTRNGGNTTNAVVGSKRSASENWGRSNGCKRSRQVGKTIVLNAKGSSNGIASGRMQQHHDSATAVAEAVAVAKQTNSVLMNLLVSGCDLSAGYVCMNSSVKNRSNSSSTANKYPSFSSPLICMARK